MTLTEMEQGIARVKVDNIVLLAKDVRRFLDDNTPSSMEFAGQGARMLCIEATSLVKLLDVLSEGG